MEVLLSGAAFKGQKIVAGFGVKEFG